MEVLAKVAFAAYALIILGGSVAAVGSSSLVRALVGLIVTLFGVAGMYMLLNSPFLAFMQILIYVGAVCVLVFFAIMLTRAHAEGEEGERAPVRQYLFGLLAGLAPASVLSFVIMTKPAASKAMPMEVPVVALGKGLFEQYFLAFELISVVLLVAMSGAVLLAWERRDKK